MPYPRQRFQSTPLPAVQVPDVFRTLSGLMSLSGNARQMREAERQDKSRAAIERAIQESGADLDGASERLSAQGYWQEANLLRERKAEIQKAQQDALAAHVDRRTKALKFSTQQLQAVEAAETPEEKMRAWALVRPGILKALPEYERDIPQEYDERFVKLAIPFGLTQTEIGERQTAGIRKLNEAFAEGGKKLDRDKAVWPVLGQWLEDKTTGEEVAEALDTAEKLYQASPATRARFGELPPPGPLTPELKTSILARFKEDKEPKTPTSIQAAILEARARGDQPEIDRLLKLEKEYRTAGRAPKEAESPPTPAEIEAVIANPQEWRGFSPTKRDKLFVPLTQAGFDFKQAARDLTKAEKNIIERWYGNELDELKDAYNETGLEYTRRKADLDTRRRAQLGEEEPGPGSSSLPQATRKPMPKVGDIVRARGQRIRVTRITPDGRVVGTPVE